LAQTGNYFVQNFLPKTYLSHANNQGITQDTNGVMFVANTNGVLIYDGINWNICKREDEISIMCISKTQEGEIVIGAEDGDIALIAKDKGGNYIYKSLFDNSNSTKREADVVRQIICLGNSTFFLSSDRLIEYKEGKLTFYNSVDKFHTRAWVMGKHLFMIEVNKSISVLVNGKFKTVKGTESLAGEKPFFFYSLSSSRCAIGFRNPGIYMAYYDSIKPENTRFEKRKSACDTEISESGINNGCLMRNGNFIVTTNFNGAFELDSNLRIVRRFNTKNGISDNNVKAAFEDRNGNIWMPLFYGISYIERSSRLFQYTRNNGISGAVQSAAFFENKLFIGTDKGVQYYDSLEEKFLAFQDFNIQCWYLYANKNKLFIGADKGLYVYLNGKIQQISENKTKCIYSDPIQPNIVYVGTDAGVESYWLMENEINFITNYELNSSVSSIASDSNKNIYFITQNRSIFYLNYNTENRLDSITGKDGLTKDDFETYLFSYKDKLLLGTDTGLYALVEKGANKFKCMKDPVLWPLTKTSQVFRAAQFGDGIICHQKFVNAEQNKSEEKIVYIEENKLKGNFKVTPLSHLSDVTPNLITYDSLRNLIFICANEGLFILKSRTDLDKKKYNPTVRAFISKQDTLIENSSSQQDFTEDRFVIPYKNNDVTLVLGFTSYETGGIEFSYQLQGRDINFTKWSKSNIVSLNNLREGKYTLLIKARTDLEDKEYTLEIPFKISPPWYRSVLAYISYALLFLAFIYVVVKLNSKRLLEDNRKLEKTIEERTSTISHQKEEIEHKQKEILDSINYAQRIQRALLASEKLLNKNLPDYFVFFQPKDVVSGDFYWAAELKNKQFALVTADSTGHGVPGAIMSMLNISCLKEAVESEKLYSAKDILNHTRKKVIETLANDGSESGGKDGMDCSLICLDLKNNQFTYAAANNPVWVIRINGDTKEKELIELSPDKMPVGKHDRDSVSFNEHVFELQKGDVIYTLTDGLPDQFGGPKGKKFMYKQLKELLLSISNLSMQDQKSKLLEALENWRGYNEQVDDICLIGVRV